MRLSVSRTAKICPIEITANISRCVNDKIAQLHSRPYSPNYQRLFPAAFALAHVALTVPLHIQVWLQEWCQGRDEETPEAKPRQLARFFG